MFIYNYVVKGGFILIYNPMFTQINLALFAILSVISLVSGTTTFFSYYLFAFLAAETAYLVACGLSKPSAVKE